MRVQSKKVQASSLARLDGPDEHVSTSSIPEPAERGRMFPLSTSMTCIPASLACAAHLAMANVYRRLCARHLCWRCSLRGRIRADLTLPILSSSLGQAASSGELHLRSQNSALLLHIPGGAVVTEVNPKSCLMVTARPRLSPPI